VLEKEDWGAPTNLNNVNSATFGLDAVPSMVRFVLNDAATAAIDCNQENQFRMRPFNVSNGNPYTNFNDLYVHGAHSPWVQR
jgi:hypothetical protein